MKEEEKYLPVDLDFIALCEAQIAKSTSGKVHFFDKGTIGLAEGVALNLLKSPSGHYIEISNQLVRLDKIITLFGKPGPSYDVYDRFGNVCLTCEDLGQF